MAIKCASRSGVSNMYLNNDYRNYLMHTDEDMKYGLPKKKKYPMPDRDHVMSAIKFFNYVSPADEKELARNIIARIREYGITGINVGENNRFRKYYNPEEKVLEHHGILGMKWGVQNGPPYPLGASDHSVSEKKAGWRKSLSKSSGAVFISGSSKTQDENSGYYRKNLPRGVRKSIDRYIKDGRQINVGDAPGIDRQVQDYLKSKGYKNVTVYGPGKKVRYSADSNWKTKPVNNPKAKEGSKEWLVAKDKAMERDSSEGLAVILPNGGAGATRNNIARLSENGKPVSVFELSDKGSAFDHRVSTNSVTGEKNWFKDVRKFSSQNLDKWGKSENKNILYITGTSGSGKSSLANFLGDDGKTQVINLDSYLSEMSSNSRNALQNKDFNSFLKSKGVDYKNVIKDGKLNYKIVDSIASASEQYGRKAYKNGNKVIIEGVQIFDETFYPNRDVYKKSPVIALRTNPIKTNMQGSYRDSENTFEMLWLMAYRLPNTIKTDRAVREFEKDLGLVRSKSGIMEMKIR